MKPDTDPLAGTDGPDPSWDRPGQEGVDGEDAPKPKTPEVKPKRGRPRCADEPLGPITVHVPPQTHDRLIRLASQRRQPVSEYLRDVLAQLFHGRS